MKLTKKERTQNEIIDAAKEIIHQNGYESVTVRNLAEKTGYTYTNLYYYFKDLNALLWLLRIKMVEDMISDLTSVTHIEDNSINEIISSIYSYVDYFFSHPNVFKFFYFYSFVQPDGDDSNLKMENKFRGIWDRTFSKLISENILPIEDIEIIIKTIIYSVQGMIMLCFSTNGKLNQEIIKDEISKIILNLIRKK